VHSAKSIISYCGRNEAECDVRARHFEVEETGDAYSAWRSWLACGCIFGCGKVNRCASFTPTCPDQEKLDRNEICARASLTRS
jgi:hypothetical protein